VNVPIVKHISINWNVYADADETELMKMQWECRML
jgi:hypothetical protein